MPQQPDLRIHEVSMDGLGQKGARGKQFRSVLATIQPMGSKARMAFIASLAAAWPGNPHHLTAEAPPAGRWAFAPLLETAPPESIADESRNPVDAFIAEGWRREELSPVGVASRRTLVRRLFVDLIGLPPTPLEIETFLGDESPDSYERLVDRLLASPRFGERQGRRWLDVVRYADTAGDNADYPVPEARLYRDYIIDSFNADKPYDQLVREQLAGDLLALDGPPEHFAERVTATGFLALSRRYATGPFELMHLTIEDTVETTGRAFLGLTLRCARCHDHKHDPITMQDYYGLYGIFSSTRYPYAGSEEFQSKSIGRMGFVPLLPPSMADPLVRAHQERLRACELEIEQAAEKEKRPEAEVKRLKAELSLLKRTNLPAEMPSAYAVWEGTPEDARAQILGDPGRPGPKVPRGAPRLPGCPEPTPVPSGSSGRRELADWLTRPEHPLTARVMANRVWQSLLGRGLVATPSDFGAKGAPPTHPELLDWLALYFQRSGWSIKSLYRLIVTSRVYQLSSDAPRDLLARDPANRWLARQVRRRLDAEALRDTILVTSGLLDLSRPPAHPFPPLSAWSWTQHNPFKADYPSNHRTVYFMTQRIQKHPYCGLFDGPDANTTTDQRSESTVPQQALFLRNNSFVGEAAHSLARRVIAQGRTAGDRARIAVETIWCRPPTPAETARLVAFTDEAALELASGGALLAELEVETWASLIKVLLASNELIYVD